MIIQTCDGKSFIRITYFGAQRKMARAAMAAGDHSKAATHFKLIRNGKEKLAIR